MKPPRAIALSQLVLLAALLAGLAPPAPLPAGEAAGEGSTASPAPVLTGEATPYRIDLARHFFASPEAEVAARQALNAALTELAALRGRVGASPENLLAALHLHERALVELHRHAAYLHLRSALDTRDAAAEAGESALYAEVDSRTSFLAAELAAIDAAAFDRMAARLPALARYRFALESARRQGGHARPVAEEELLARVAPSASGWQYDLYRLALDRAPFGTVPAPAGPLDVGRQWGAISRHPDREVRRAGFVRRWAALGAERDLFAFALLGLARAGNRLAGLHHFDAAASEAYFSRFLDKPRVSGLLAALGERAGVYRRYQEWRAEAARAASGAADVHPWDVGPTLSGAAPPRFTLAAGTRAVETALAPLGPHFSAALAALLDPANGRLDLAGGEHRYGGGFSEGFVGVDSVFFASDFDGSYDHLRRLTHEATHAVHRQLMSESGVSPEYASGPSYLFESFASFSELRLALSLAGEARDPALRRFFLEQAVEGKGTVMFVAGPEAELEQAVYEGVEKGSLAGADELDALTRQVFSRWSIWPEREPLLAGQWMAIPLMYEDPFYDLNYVYAGLLALDYEALYERDPAGFAARYSALLEHGFDASPDELLRTYLGVDLDPEKLVATALPVLEARIAELEAATPAPGSLGRNRVGDRAGLYGD